MVSCYAQIGKSYERAAACEGFGSWNGYTPSLIGFKAPSLLTGVPAIAGLRGVQPAAEQQQQQQQGPFVILVTRDGRDIAFRNWKHLQVGGWVGGWMERRPSSSLIHIFLPSLTRWSIGAALVYNPMYCIIVCLCFTLFSLFFFASSALACAARSSTPRQRRFRPETAPPSKRYAAQAGGRARAHGTYDQGHRSLARYRLHRCCRLAAAAASASCSSCSCWQADVWSRLNLQALLCGEQLLPRSRWIHLKIEDFVLGDTSQRRALIQDLQQRLGILALRRPMDELVAVFDQAIDKKQSGGASVASHYGKWKAMARQGGDVAHDTINATLSEITRVSEVALSRLGYDV